MGRPLRPVPDDFAETFERLGWGSVEHYGTRADRVSRWLREIGRSDAIKKRRNYVLGNRLNQKSFVTKTTR